jgi:hypothetical protein
MHTHSLRHDQTTREEVNTMIQIHPDVRIELARRHRDRQHEEAARERLMRGALGESPRPAAPRRAIGIRLRPEQSRP